MSIECAVCEIAAGTVLADGVDPKFWLERDADGTVLCRGCQAIREANQRFADGDW